MISALIELMNTYYMSGDFTQLGTVAWTLFKSVPDDIVSAHFLAFAYIKTGRHGDARTLFEQLRARLPKRARPARTSIAAEQRAEAVCLSEATVRNPGYAATWHALALDLEQSGQGTASIALLRFAITARPGYIEALRDMARIGLAVGELDAAHEACTALLAAVPGDEAALGGLQQVLALRVLNRVG
jgi:tetratricopeptide (TPR) repeat protein